VIESDAVPVIEYEELCVVVIVEVFVGEIVAVNVLVTELEVLGEAVFVLVVEIVGEVDPVIDRVMLILFVKLTLGVDETAIG